MDKCRYGRVSEFVVERAAHDSGQGCESGAGDDGAGSGCLGGWRSEERSLSVVYAGWSNLITS